MEVLGDWTQDFVCAKQILYHWAIPSPEVDDFHFAYILPPWLAVNFHEQMDQVLPSQSNGTWKCECARDRLLQPLLLWLKNSSQDSESWKVMQSAVGKEPPRPFTLCFAVRKVVLLSSTVVWKFQSGNHLKRIALITWISLCVSEQCGHLYLGTAKPVSTYAPKLELMCWYKIFRQCHFLIPICHLSTLFVSAHESISRG